MSVPSDLDVALRDFVLALGAFAPARLGAEFSPVRRPRSTVAIVKARSTGTATLIR